MLHTAGHLISSVVTDEINADLITVKGFHYQQGSFVEFSSASENPILDGQQLQDILQNRIQDNLPIKISIVNLTSEEYQNSFKIAGFMPPEDQPLRLVKIGNYIGYPCGGTHVRSTIKIENLLIKSIKNKKGNIRVSYTCSIDVSVQETTWEN